MGSPAQPLPSQAPKKAKRRAAAEGSSNVFSMFDQTQIQEFKEVREGDSTPPPHHFPTPPPTPPSQKVHLLREEEGLEFLPSHQRVEGNCWLRARI